MASSSFIARSLYLATHFLIPVQCDCCGIHQDSSTKQHRQAWQSLATGNRQVISGLRSLTQTLQNRKGCTYRLLSGSLENRH